MTWHSCRMGWLVNGIWFRVSRCGRCGPCVWRPWRHWQVLRCFGSFEVSKSCSAPQTLHLRFKTKLLCSWCVTKQVQWITPWLRYSVQRDQWHLVHLWQWQHLKARDFGNISCLWSPTLSLMCRQFSKRYTIKWNDMNDIEWFWIHIMRDDIT